MLNLFLILKGVLGGSKAFVADGVGADAFIVAARTAGQPGERAGISLFIVAADAPGVQVSPMQTLDSRNHANLQLQQVRVGAAALMGAEGEGFAALDAALDRGRVCLAAELLGCTQSLFDTTVDYLKTRVQFDVPIGSFQALQHRAAWCYAQLELARSSVMAGLAALDDPALDGASRARMASLAKWKAGDTAHRVSREAVQMHGGMGSSRIEAGSGWRSNDNRALEERFVESTLGADLEGKSTRHRTFEIHDQTTTEGNKHFCRVKRATTTFAIDGQGRFSEKVGDFKQISEKYGPEGCSAAWLGGDASKRKATFSLGADSGGGGW